MILDFASLIVAESKTLDSSQSDRLKLSSLGNIYYDYAQQILVQSQQLLDLATQPQIDPQEDTIVDESFGEFLDGWLRQSVSGNFLDAYLVPRERQSYSKRRTTEIQELTKAEAIESFAQDLVREAIATAEPEDIQSWSDCMLEVMEGNCNYNFAELVKLSGLSPGQVFLALFLSDCFSIVRNEADFYGNFSVKVKHNKKKLII